MRLATLRWPALALGAVLPLLVVAFMLIGVLFFQLAQARDDLARVEAGTALVTVRVGAFREQLGLIEPELTAGLEEAIASLEAFFAEPVEFTVEVDESVRIEAGVPLDYELSVPIRMIVPIDETIETTVQVAGPLGLDLPVDVTIPVRVDVPVATDARLQLSETIPLVTTVPLQLDVAVRLDQRATSLGALASSLLEMLVAVRGSLSGIR